MKSFGKEKWGIERREVYIITVAEAMDYRRLSVTLCVVFLPVFLLVQSHLHWLFFFPISSSHLHHSFLTSLYYSFSPLFAPLLLLLSSPPPPQVCRITRCGAAEGVSTWVRLPRPWRLRYECGQCVGKSSCSYVWNPGSRSQKNWVIRYNEYTVDVLFDQSCILNAIPFIPNLYYLHLFSSLSLTHHTI